jgi:enoyl-CoA hydratase
MDEASLLVKFSGRIALLTLNRPRALNALSSELRALLIQTLTTLDESSDVSVAILTGSGRAFCAGLDLKEIVSSGQHVDANVGAQNVVAAIGRFSKPLIAAVNGLAITGGLEICLACDLLVASESAQFADTHVKVGINPGWGLSQRLSRAIGIFRAKELSLTGRFFSARQAYEWGLVNRVVPDEQLLACAHELAEQIAANELQNVTRMKAVMDAGFALNLGDALEMEAARASMLNSEVTASAVDAAHSRARGPE